MNIIKIILALFLSAAATFADVNDGDTCKINGTTYTFTITVVPGMGTAEIIVTTDTGAIGRTSGAPGSGGVNNPSVSEMDPFDIAGTTIKVSSGKLKKQNADGTWSSVRKRRVDEKSDEDGIGTGPLRD